MYSTKTPKTPSGKAAKGSVQVTNSHGRLQFGSHQTCYKDAWR